VVLATQIGWDLSSISLLLPSERRSVEPIAAAPEGVSAQHQSMLHFNNQQGWPDEKDIRAREMVVPVMEPHGPIEAWMARDNIASRQRHHVLHTAYSLPPLRTCSRGRRSP